ncbi:MAG: hypothetical protein AB7O97_02980 [Planctomycetota bacterium]
MPETFTAWIALIANLATALGIPIALLSLGAARREHRRNRDKDASDREFGTYDELDHKYVEFVFRCTQHPHLDLFSEPLPADRRISPADLRIERAYFAALISLFERAVVMFEHRAHGSLRDDQRAGWVRCMESYCTRPSFVAEWRAIGAQFDESFQREMNAIMRRLGVGAAAEPRSR